MRKCMASNGLVSDLYWTYPAVNITCILGYESSWSFSSPKKIYLIGYKTAFVRVIFLFKELSHILWGPEHGLFIIFPPSSHWKTKLKSKYFKNNFLDLFIQNFTCKTLGARMHYIIFILYWAFLFLTLYLHW